MDDTTTKNRPPAGDERGLECRHCGCHHFYIVDTRRASGTRLIRRWECRHCGHQITTTEQEARQW